MIIFHQIEEAQGKEVSGEKLSKKPSNFFRAKTISDRTRSNSDAGSKGSPVVGERPKSVLLAGKGAPTQGSFSSI